MALWKYGLSCSNQQFKFHENENVKNENTFRFKETNQNQYRVVYSYLSFLSFSLTLRTS